MRRASLLIAGVALAHPRPRAVLRQSKSSALSSVANEQVCSLVDHYGPRHKSPIHYHPNSVTGRMSKIRWLTCGVYEAMPDLLH